jgi:hypothetical protein
MDSCDSCAQSVDSTSQPHAALAATLSKSPTSAALLSLALPGLGQYYVESYWKIPVFTGTALVTGLLVMVNHGEFTKASASYDNAVAEQNQALAQRTLLQREAYRDNRDISAVVLVVTYALSIVDAYVGAHLFDFSVSETLSQSITIQPSGTLAYQLQLHW